MKWWPFSSSGGDAQPKSSDGGIIAPTRTDRQACYNSRDIFFKCLDRNDILDSEDNPAQTVKACAEEHKIFEKDCASAWVKYFKQKRVVDWKKEEALRKYQMESSRMPPDIQQTSS
ncbi:hypothetical protein EJ05DRAFT_483148 [Pseudovirgaria hyperparasitica]|uniref:Cytochrome c oxidase, subunit VIb n=1 Tax=Pseudovirgaria hyperparasitica TaxID=470096 RepID=A0A6A6WGD0_9PEZI|nr:uncharacterized protein EJ05DRAFT_483148 [Pseudovirgaria hyperparasitica]KAF2760687.1 hypothetical protein EJ05DRAFT_483148 [Pseudovirgaria hyperparasitica]